MSTTTVIFTKKEKNSQKMTVVFCDKVIVNRHYDKVKGMIITSIVLVEKHENSHNIGAEYHTLVDISSDGSIIYEGEKYSGWSCGPSKAEDLGTDYIISSEADFDDYISVHDSEWWDSDFEEV